MESWRPCSRGSGKGTDYNCRRRVPGRPVRQAETSGTSHQGRCFHTLANSLWTILGHYAVSSNYRGIKYLAAIDDRITDVKGTGLLSFEFRISLRNHTCFYARLVNGNPDIHCRIVFVNEKLVISNDLSSTGVRERPMERTIMR